MRVVGNLREALENLTKTTAINRNSQRLYPTTLYNRTKCPRSRTLTGDGGTSETLDFAVVWKTGTSVGVAVVRGIVAFVALGFRWCPISHQTLTE